MNTEEALWILGMFWFLISLCWAGWAFGEIVDNDRKINWKTFPIFAIIMLPGVVTLFLFFGTAFLLITAYEVIAKKCHNLGPFK